MSLRRWMVMMTTAMQGGGAGAVTIPDPVAYWKLDEESAGSAPVTRVDSVGSNDLTDNNTTPSTTGKIGRGSNFNASNQEFLSIDDNADLSTGDVHFWVACWIKPASVAGNFLIASKGTNTDNNREWILWHVGSPLRLQFNIYNNGVDAGNVKVIANSFGALSADTWYFVMAWHDPDLNTINIQVNGGDVDSADASSVTIMDSNGPFKIGGYWAPIYMNGVIDEFGLWKPGEPPSTAQISKLYNGGDGLTHPF